MSETRATDPLALAQSTTGATARGALFAIILVAANLRAATAGVGSVLPDIVADTGWPSAIASGLVVLPLVLFALVSPVAPAIARVLGMDRAVVLALLFLSLGIVVRSTLGPVGLWGGTVLLGSGIAVLNVLAPALVKRDFATKVGTMTSVYTAVQGLAATVAVGVVALILSFDQQWRIALLAPVVIAAVALVYLSLRRQQRRGHDSPLPIAMKAARPSTPWAKPLAWGLALFMGMQSTVYYVLLTWMPAIEQSNGVSAVAAGLNQSALQAASVLAVGIAMPFLGRSVDQRPLVLISTLTMAIGVVGLMLVPAAGLVWAIIIGAACGVTLVLALTLFGLRTRTVSETQAVSSMGQSFGYLVAAICPLLAGAAHDVTASWSLPLGALLALLLVQGIAGLFAAKPAKVWEEMA